MIKYFSKKKQNKKELIPRLIFNLEIILGPLLRKSHIKNYLKSFFGKSYNYEYEYNKIIILNSK